MRILLVSGFFESHGGGIEIVAGAMARALAARGHLCRLAAAAFDPAPADTSIQSVPLDSTDPVERWTGLPMPLPSASARKRLREEVLAADAVIVHDALYASSLLAIRYARQSRKPWMVVQHIGAIPFTGRMLRAAMVLADRFVTRPVIRSAPHAVFISDLVRQAFSRELTSARLSLLFNGVDHGLFYPPARRNTSADGHRRVLFVGRFVEKKGLRAMRSLAQQRPHWQFLMVGQGPIDPASWALTNVSILGRKSRAELAQLYREVDALVLPSVGEGFPLVIQEAMASGLEVFCGLDSAAADPGAVSILHGIEVDPQNPDATAARFARAIEATVPAIDHVAAAHARDCYDWDRNAERLDHLLRELGAPPDQRTAGSTQPLPTSGATRRSNN